MGAGAALVLALLYVATAGGAYIIQVDYSWAGEFLDGASVVINDSIVGTLEPHAGGQRIKGFEVDPGIHVVKVEMEDCDGIPHEVSFSEGGGRRAVLMADMDDGYRCRVRLW